MLSRDEKKLQTRKSLMDAALVLVGNGDNFASISLREVAKTAGVVPTSFYRHFTDMEELGLNLVDELGLLLRKLMRTTRQQERQVHGLIRNSVAVYTQFVTDHRNHFVFMCQCRSGGTPALRSALRNELKFFATELASDIRQLNMLPDTDSGDLDQLCQLIVATVSESTIDLLDQADSSPTFLQEYVENMVKRLKIIWLGAEAWRS